MKQQFHMTPDGPKQCTASVKPCKYGDSQHYENIELAQKVFENEMTAKHGVANSLSKNKNSWSSSTTSDDIAQAILDDTDDDGWVSVAPSDTHNIRTVGISNSSIREDVFQITKNRDNTFTVESLSFPVKTDFQKKKVSNSEELQQFVKHHQGLNEELEVAQEYGYDEAYEALVMDEGTSTYYPTSSDCSERYAGEGDDPKDFAKNIVEDTLGDSTSPTEAEHYATWVDREKLAEDLEEDDTDFHDDEAEEAPDYDEIAETFIDIWKQDGNGEQIKKYMDYKTFAENMQRDGSMTFVDSQRENKVFGFFPG